MFYQRFSYKTLEELETEAKDLGVKISFSQDLSPLTRPISLAKYSLANSIAVLPMEGCDGYRDGRPAELTFRRYRRYAKGGAGLLWLEATAIVSEGRANPRQLLLIKENLQDFSDLVMVIHREAERELGRRPVCILQLTHSGRYSAPDSVQRPMYIYNDPLLDPRSGVTSFYKPVSDAQLDQLIQSYVDAAVLAREAGFDGVDIKACHRYLVSELLSAHTRPGKYGGSLENRMRFLLTVVEEVRKAAGSDFLLSVRLNVYDALPWPYAWGVDHHDEKIWDLTEPKILAQTLVTRGVSLLGISAGNPYYCPHVGRPYDTPQADAYPPDEHPLLGVSRLLSMAAEIQRAVPQATVVGSGYSWLRQFLPQAAAASLATGDVKLVGVGRMAYSYPDFAKDILSKGNFTPPTAIHYL